MDPIIKNFLIFLLYLAVSFVISFIITRIFYKKRTEKNHVGTILIKNGEPSLIEYTVDPKELAHMKSVTFDIEHDS